MSKNKDCYCKYRTWKLGMCSIGAKGLFFEVLRLATDPEYSGGRLVNYNGSPLSDADLKRLTGCSSRELSSYMQELLSADILRVGDDNIIYVPDAVRQCELSKVRKEAGEVGGKSSRLLNRTIGVDYSAKRLGIPKRLRFLVFERDKFTCQYCGRSAPNVSLVVDHINPVANNGETTTKNLITSCKDCNSGKSDLVLSPDLMARFAGKCEESTNGI